MENECQNIISHKGLEKLLSKALDNIQEERDLSLERYRRQDEAMTSSEDFILQGKNAVDYLKVAADRSNAMLSVAKLIKDILYKEDGNQQANASIDDEQKKEILRIIRENQ